MSAAPVTNAMRVAIPASTLTRRRKLKIGSRTGPVVRDKRDPESNATGFAGMPPTISLAQMKGFTLFTLKAVLSGRGDEIVDLAKVNLFR